MALEIAGSNPVVHPNWPAVITGRAFSFGFRRRGETSRRKKDILGCIPELSRQRRQLMSFERLVNSPVAGEN